MSLAIEEVTIARLHAAYQAGETTARSVVRAYLDRIDAYDRRGPYLNSLIHVNANALAEADRLDASLRSTGRLSGKLHGVPVIIKDNLDTADMPTSSGVALFKDFVPSSDAFVVSLLRAAGAILLAKASLSELAMGLADNINSVLPGFTRNPYNIAYASGGPVAALALPWLPIWARSESAPTRVAAFALRPRSTIWSDSGRQWGC
jgi:Asp-tRNA(Asn)/Glu-tRNA(Gln) amidotransferase A subunit family amidase